ncbi:hypothetical protein [Streptomyces phaeochromogenes]|uniref:hypothetical protein n=1 Tax=Streptomyces phaeochromogenes TaxID=1923 RepID=UPI002DD88E73|nr:hypothetical protein [Streptomyces phaeochromogenes]
MSVFSSDLDLSAQDVTGNGATKRAPPWCMATLIASALAVLGALLGAGLTLAFQQRATDRSHRFIRGEKLRQERLDAYSAYGGVLINYRRCLIHLWFCEHEQPPTEDPEAVRLRAYGLRTSAQEALFKVQMLTDDETLSQAADSVPDEVNALARAESRTQLEDRRARTRIAIRRLIRSARQHL